MSAALKENPALGGNPARGNQVNGQSTNYTQAQEAFKQLRKQPGFDERDFLSWDAGKFTQIHGITLDDLAEIRSDARRRARADRFEWLQAVSQHRKIKLRALRVAVALFSFANERGYCWPSQRTIARSIGYADTINSAREIRGAIADLAAIGSIEVLKLPHLPKELADKAMGATTAGGSGRNCRGKAYALVLPEQWKEKATQGLIAPMNTGADCPSITTSSNPDVLAHDSTYTDGSSSESLMAAATSQSLVMERIPA